MTWLMENPLAIIAGGVLVELTLAAILFSTGRVVILGAMFLAGAATFGLLLTERLVVTDGESVQITLNGAAGAMMTSDPAKVLNYVDPQATGLRQQIESIMPRFSFKEVRIPSDIELELHPDANSPTARARFWVRARVSERHGGGAVLMGHEEMLERLTVDLRKSDKRWLITNAERAERRL